MPLFTDYQGVADGVSFVPCESELIGDAVERIVLQLGGYPNRAVVVSPTKKGPGGVGALNARLHERLRPSGAPAHDIKGFNAQYYTIGDPVMWLRNDYSRGMKTSPPDAVLVPDASARSAWDDEHGGKRALRFLRATRFIFLKPVPP